MTSDMPAIRTGADLPLFYEYFHGDTGRGIGASHQTGWTALVATILRDLRSTTGDTEEFATIDTVEAPSTQRLNVEKGRGVAQIQT